MLGRLLLVFTVIPFVDLLLLLRIADVIGPVETLGVVILTGVVGAYLARSQGVQTVRRIQHRLQQGASPSDELTDGALIIAGAALLATPGLITDGVGFVFLLPFTRPPLRRVVQSYFRRKAQQGYVHVETY
ncbi:FxsA family protein [Halorutilales archaeon Cl-col2-1]